MFSAATGGVVSKGGYNLPAPGAILSTVFEGVQLPFDKALSIESKYFAKLLTDPVARNIIRTTFISKTAAERGARRPAGVPKLDTKKVGVLGACMLGVRKRDVLGKGLYIRVTLGCGRFSKNKKHNLLNHD